MSKKHNFVKIRKYIISNKQLSCFQILRHSVCTFYKSHSCESKELGKEPRRIIWTVSCGSFMPGNLILFITNASGTDTSFSRGFVAVVFNFIPFLVCLSHSGKENLHQATTAEWLQDNTSRKDSNDYFRYFQNGGGVFLKESIGKYSNWNHFGYNQPDSQHQKDAAQGAGCSTRRDILEHHWNRNRDFL